MLEWLFGRSKDEEKPKKKQSSAEETEDKWKYDFIVQFMSGPLWKTSILDFVDYHCVVFDSEEENKFEYTTLHNKFKELVASLFDTMMQEVELDDQKLAELLDRGFNSKQKKIFQQLILADDFLKFKRLMVNRNKTLEAEAIKALHQGQNSKKAAKLHKGPSPEQEVIKKSMLSEQERIQKREQQEEQELRMILEMSKKEADEAALIRSLEEKVALNETTEAAKLDANPPPSVSEPQQPEYFQKPTAVIPQESVAVPMPGQARRNRRSNMPLEPLPPVKQPPKVEESPKEQVKEVKEEIQQKPVVEEKASSVQEKPSFVEEKAAVVAKAQVESMEDRKRRLIQQRQRIRQKKEDERRKQMAEEESKPVVQTIVLQDDGIHQTQLGAVEEKRVSKEQLERRRELMKKIKNRIVDDF